ncbi:MAG: marine proteobacterial sortase target protein [Gammaproteobacteria bacterium]|nr:marine proteobacterial sortase target protein [Gammaproteobacteria bacterium]
MRNPTCSRHPLPQSATTPVHNLYTSLLPVSMLLLGLVVFANLVSPASATELEAAGGSSEINDGPAAHIDPPDFDAVTSGTLYFEDVNRYLDAAILNSSVHMKINGIVARVSTLQTFSNTSPHWLEGIYVFPLPENAAVNAMEIVVGERTIKGQIAEKQQAEAAYRKAKSSGQLTSLVSRERPNLFTTRIANIAPGESISITLTYTQTITYRNERFSLTFPMTLTPRYSNASVTDVAAITPPQFDRHSINGPSTTLQIDFPANQSLSTISSPSHQVTLSESDSFTTLTLVGPVPMDRDFVLHWSPAFGAEPTVSTWQENVEGRDYLLAMIVPPDARSLLRDIPRELILVMDTSGSMAGQSMLAARQALHTALDGLRSGDRFNIIAFDSDAYNLFPASRVATEDPLRQARRFVQSLQAEGGTEMSEALRRALANPVEGYLRQVVFFTDGSIGNENQLFRQIEQQLRHARLFTVGIGSAPNDWFMKKAAQLGRGTFTFVPHISAAPEKINALLKQIDTPALTDLDIEWYGDTAELAPSPLQDLYAGEPLVFSAELGPNTTGFIVRGMQGDVPWEQDVTLAETTVSNTGLSTVWANRKIASLLDLQRTNGEPELYKNRITQIALDHQLVSPYTSFVAIDKNPVRAEGEPLESTRLANLLPAGSTMRPLHLPTGATGIDTLWVFSFLCGTLALFLSRVQGRRQP